MCCRISRRLEFFDSSFLLALSLFSLGLIVGRCMPTDPWCYLKTVVLRLQPPGALLCELREGSHRRPEPSAVASTVALGSGRDGQ